MKISINDKELFTLSEIKKKVIANDIPMSECDKDLERRIEYIVMHKYEQCFKRLKAEWDNKLAENGLKNIPLNKDEYAALVFAQPNYKDRAARDALNRE